MTKEPPPLNTYWEYMKAKEVAGQLHFKKDWMGSNSLSELEEKELKELVVRINKYHKKNFKI